MPASAEIVANRIAHLVNAFPNYQIVTWIELYGDGDEWLNKFNYIMKNKKIDFTVSGECLYEIKINTNNTIIANSNNLTSEYLLNSSKTTFPFDNIPFVSNEMNQKIFNDFKTL